MVHESVFRTQDLPAADRFEAWIQRMGRTHAPMQLSSEHAADYDGSQRAILLGDVTVWPATFDPLVFRRTPRLIRASDPEAYHLSLLLKGEGAASWGSSRQAVYTMNDFHVSTSSRPFEIHTGADPVTIVGVEMPRAQVPLPGRHADQVMGRRISATEGIGALLAQFLLRIAADTSRYRPADGPRLATVVTDLVAAAFAHALDADPSLPPESRHRTLALRVKAFVRRHLADPGLTPATIAAAHHISRSHLYRLFRAEGLTVASYIRDQRLEHARRDLLDPARSTEPIHAVAARWGFPRAAEFTRAFRTAYGLPPSELRARERPRPGPPGDAPPSDRGRLANDTAPRSGASW
ncbi:helix-turn-helix domain-containing protein [Streptomyces sp. NPDC017202]|uniref:helix-turn-helix domain-containing protein n=1 Tax=Streptomyces sp. NPDC017202 TaxID=3364981 RepID=UPI0037B85909